ncbi:MAG TPA: hypothetical protein VML75_17860 [Kofleriaceae bacterium]|nr:hypothetical protein [Kofleriaceae bacterium]
MRNLSIAFLAALALTLATAQSASAQERSGVGVGVGTMLTTQLSPFGGAAPGVAQLTFDSGTFYITGMLALAVEDQGDTVIGIGGRFYFPVHNGDRSDFSLGGGLALLNTDPDGPGESDTSVFMELGGRMRAFLNANVALDAGVGIGILIADDGGGPPNNNAFGLLGNLVGSLGMTYFFW